MEEKNVLLRELETSAVRITISRRLVENGGGFTVCVLLVLQSTLLFSRWGQAAQQLLHLPCASGLARAQVFLKEKEKRFQLSLQVCAEDSSTN